MTYEESGDNIAVSQIREEYAGTRGQKMRRLKHVKVTPGRASTEGNKADVRQ